MLYFIFGMVYFILRIVFFYPPSICDYVIHERPLLLEVFVFGKVYFVFVTVNCNTLVHTMDKPNPPTRMICFVYDFRFGAFLYLGCFVFVLVFFVIGIERFVFVMANFIFVMPCFAFVMANFVFGMVNWNTLAHPLGKPNQGTSLICFVYDCRDCVFLYLGLGILHLWLYLWW